MVILSWPLIPFYKGMKEESPLIGIIESLGLAAQVNIAAILL
jgi:hypothetical protein